MFGDLDWPINASRRFVSDSWVSCFIGPCATFLPNFCENRLSSFCGIPLTNKRQWKRRLLGAGEYLFAVAVYVGPRLLRKSETFPHAHFFYGHFWQKRQNRISLTWRCPIAMSKISVQWRRRTLLKKHRRKLSAVCFSYDCSQWQCDCWVEGGVAPVNGVEYSV